jgi:hypothetical protein
MGGKIKAMSLEHFRPSQEGGLPETNRSATFVLASAEFNQR